MKPSVYRISLDVYDAHSSVCLVMKQKDTARQISITLTDGGFPYQIAEECYAVFAATKADGKKLLHHCSIHNNTIHYVVRPQTTAVVGLCECEIKLYGSGDKLLMSPGFSILVSEDAVTDEDELVSEDEVDALTHLISEATTVITEGKAVNAEGEALNQESEALIADMEAKRTELEQQIADAAASAGAANKSALRAEVAATSASNSASLANNRLTDATTAAENAKASEEAAKSSASTAVNMANAALASQRAAEEAAKKLEDHEPCVASVNGTLPDENGNVQFDWVAQKTLHPLIILDEQTVSAGFNSNLKYDKFEGQGEVVVTFDDKLYLCVPEFGYNEGDGHYVYVGNKSLLSSGETDTGEPFLIWGFGAGPLMLKFEEGDEHTMSVTGSVYEYDKLPEGYLPDGLVKSVNGVAPDEDGNVKITIPGGTVKSVNGVSPDASGNVEIEVPDSGQNVDSHADYFTITDDGVAALKPEYRGASTRTECPYSISDMGSGVEGSKNTELPEHLVIPEIIAGKAVGALAVGIFHKNLYVKNVTLPVTIDVIPERCFDGASNLKNVHNTASIVSIGKCAFQSTAVDRLSCPNLEQISGISTFQHNGRLVYVDVGKITSVPDKTFNGCIGLHMVKSKNSVASVGTQAFSATPNLKQAGFISKLTNIGQAAFLCSGVEYDWSALSGCTFGTDATPLQYNPTDFWSACTVTPCENRLPTTLGQKDARWASRKIGTTSYTYGTDGCLLMCAIHAYCGLHNLHLSSVMEFEEVVNGIDSSLLNTFTKALNNQKAFLEGLGLTVERYATYDQTVLQALYDALAAGKYAIIGLNGGSVSLGHAVLAYGVNDKGEILIIDSSDRYRDNPSEAVRWSLPFEKLTAPNYNDHYILNIISL